MSLYHGDDPTQFYVAAQSVIEQTLLPAELLIVVDGPSAMRWRACSTVVAGSRWCGCCALPENWGLGHARNVAIRNARSEIIAVMDADDICVENRFETTIAQ